MTKAERVRAACAGASVDRVPYSLWYHFPLDPPVGEGLVRAELDFYHRYDPDLLKVMHDIPYEMPVGMPAVERAEDWGRLPVLDGATGNFGAQIETVRAIMAGRGDDGPVIDTVFGVFATAEKLCGKRTLEMLGANPEAVHQGLRAIAASLSNYARALLSAGADGIYLAISGAASDTMPEEEYREHFLPYDQQVLESAAGGWLNVAHHHGVGVYPDLVLGLAGFQVYSWSSELEGNPTVGQVRPKTALCLMGGVNEVTFGRVTPEEVVRQVRQGIEATGGRAYIAGPGCAVPTPPASSEANLSAFRRGVEGSG